MGGTAFAFRLEKFEFAENNKIAVGRITHHFELVLHLAVGHRPGGNGKFEDGALPLVEFLDERLRQARFIWWQTSSKRPLSHVSGRSQSSTRGSMKLIPRSSPDFPSRLCLTADFADWRR